MSVRKGVLEVVIYNGTYTSIYDVWEFNFDGETILALKNRGESNLATPMYVDRGIDTLADMFTDMETPNPVLTWTTPLTEVPSTDSGAAPTEITAGANLNNITAYGAYYRAANVTVTNAPSAIGTAPFALEVISTGGDNFIQRVTRGAGTPTVYQRICYNGTFGAWATL